MALCRVRDSRMFKALQKIYSPLGIRFGRSKGRALPVGLDIGSRLIKMVKLTQVESKEWYLDDLRTLEVETRMSDREDSIREQEIVTALMRLVKEAHLEGCNVAVSISGPSVILKSIEMPWMSDEELQGHLRLEVERYLPYERNDIYWDYHVSHRSKLNEASSMFVNLVAAKKPVVDQRVALVKQCGLRPVVVDVDGLALANMFEMNYPEADQETALLVNVGASGLNMITVGGSGYTVMRDIDLLGEWSYEILNQAFQAGHDHQKFMSPDSMDEISFSVPVEEVFRDIAHDIRRVIDDYQGYEHDQAVRRIWLCGGHATVPGLVERLSEQLALPVQIADPCQQLTGFSSMETKDVASLSTLVGVAVGLGLRDGEGHD